MLPEQPNTNIIWLSQPGPGGGGGGGGNQMKEPPRQAELPGKDKITVPVSKPPKIEMQEVEEGARSGRAAEHSGEEPRGGAGLAAGRDRGAARTADAVAGLGQRRRRGHRHRHRRRSGHRARVLVPGSGGGTGGGVYRPGNGVTLPRVLHEERPQYTSDAMRAKVQGTVLLECVVQPDGSVGDVQVVRSLDPTFGLDQEAVDAARKWRFAPGTRLGEPVPVLITIELTFTLR